jgi:hypothetical protein
MALKPLTEKRAADRKVMAARVEALLKELNVEWEPGEFPGPREIKIDIKGPRGLCLSVDFDGDSWQPDVHVLSWHMSLDSDAQLSDARFGGNVNPYHKHKATYIAHGIDDLIAKLRFGLELAISGDAFIQSEISEGAKE